jgi:general secretion pathway protein I
MNDRGLVGQGFARAKSCCRALGFTLIEVLIALVILAVALAAAVRAAGVATDGAMDTKERLLGLWVAQNRLAGYASGLPFPSIGERSGKETQIDMTFTWRETVSETPNPYFRRIEIKVFSPRRADYAVAQLVSHVARKQ